MTEFEWVPFLNIHFLSDGKKEVAEVYMRGGKVIADIYCCNDAGYRAFVLDSMDEAKKFAEDVVDNGFLENFDYPNELT